jgi:hypothetical protein
MPAVLAIWNDIDPAIEADYEAWYWQDHLPQRWALFGRHCARRYRRVAGDGRDYFTFYEVEDLAIFASPEYQASLREPTEGTRRMMPHFRRMSRSLCEVVLDRGEGTGGVAATLALAPVDATSLHLPAALKASFDRLLELPGITRCRLWHTDLAATRAPNPEARLRGQPDDCIDWAIVVEGSTVERVAAAARVLCSQPVVAPAHPPASPPLYTLLAALP